MSDLRDAMITRLRALPFMGAEAAAEDADAILAMPEMQAIREWMRWAFDAVGTNADEPSLPDSVIVWVGA